MNILKKKKKNLIPILLKNIPKRLCLNEIFDDKITLSNYISNLVLIQRRKFFKLKLSFKLKLIIHFRNLINQIHYVEVHVLITRVFFVF